MEKPGVCSRALVGYGGERDRVACLRNALSLEGPSDFLVDPPRSL